ncbi:MAG: hypothetical protein H6Q69_203 [Firmicutes bacterium]|nr:hypothetical protein [Bacillota bacterium]
MEKPLIIDFNNIFLEIYLIGYSAEGESILFLLRTEGREERVVFSGVIDSFEVKSINYTDILLHHLGIQKIDLLCWTHPDRDHSIGIDSLLNKYADIDKTKIVLPCSLFENRSKLTADASRRCDTIKSATLRRNDELKYKIIYAQHDLRVYARHFRNRKAEDYLLDITALSPAPSLIIPQNYHHQLDTNSFSIALLVSFSGINALFTSDIENRTLAFLSDELEMPQKIHYIKIPHHGSSGSDKLIDIIETLDTSDIACTTVFSKHKLPEQTIINKYKSISTHVISTSDFINNEPAGIIGTQYDIKNATYSYKTSNDINDF